MEAPVRVNIDHVIEYLSRKISDLCVDLAIKEAQIKELEEHLKTREVANESNIPSDAKPIRK